MKSRYLSKYGIAEFHDEKTGITVLPVSSCPGQNRPAQIAYLGARFSRSPLGILELAEEAYNKGNSEKKLAAIFSGYGHASVGDMAQISLAIEGISIYQATRLWYYMPVVRGQESSTRYQDFSEVGFAKVDFSDFPSNSTNPQYHVHTLFRAYETAFKLAQEELAEAFDYTKVEGLTEKQAKACIKSRAFDVARSLLPCGTKTRVFMTSSARQWSTIISVLLGSPWSADIRLGTLLKEALAPSEVVTEENSTWWQKFRKQIPNYVPDASQLIRHTEPDIKYFTLLDNLSQIYNTYYYDISQPKTFLKPSLYDLGLLDRLALFTGTPNKYLTDNHAVSCHNLERLLDKIQLEIRNREFTDKNYLGNLFQAGENNTILDISFGEYRDINRHQSLERFCPFLEPYSTTKLEFAEISYAEKIPKTQKFIAETWQNYCNQIIDLSDQTSESCPDFDYAYRQLLPLGLRIPFILGMSVADWQYFCHLRGRPGGHIAYRKLANNLSKQIRDESYVTNALEANHPYVSEFNVGQFYSRQ